MDPRDRAVPDADEHEPRVRVRRNRKASSRLDAQRAAALQPSSGAGIDRNGRAHGADRKQAVRFMQQDRDAEREPEL